MSTTKPVGKRELQKRQLRAELVRLGARPLHNAGVTELRKALAKAKKKVKGAKTELLKKELRAELADIKGCPLGDSATVTQLRNAIASRKSLIRRLRKFRITYVETDGMPISVLRGLLRNARETKKRVAKEAKERR
tara:strand:- start:1109 stop:1516 length:408 start_codon:yes stop_codon:yes gene_type:complete